MAKGFVNEPVNRKTLDEAVDAILKGVEGLFKELEKRLDTLEDGQQELKVGISYIKDEIRGLKGELSDTPSRKQFHELKSRVDKYHPIS